MPLVKFVMLSKADLKRGARIVKKPKNADKRLWQSMLNASSEYIRRWHEQQYRAYNSNYD
jgi:hypothetical protein